MLLLSCAAHPPVALAQEANPPPPSLFEQIEDRFPYLRFRGTLGYTLGADTQWEDTPEDRVQGWADAFFETRMDLTDHLLAVTSGRFQHYLWAGEETRTLYEADLVECFLDFTRGPFQLRVGQQITSWGKGDLFSPLDVLNPLDLRNSLDPTPDSLKIPVLMLKSGYEFGDWNLEGVYLPFFEPMRFNLFGSDFALLKHRFPELHFGGLLGAMEQLGWVRFPRLPSPDSLDPRFSQNLQDTLLATDYPPDDFLHGEYGLILRGTWRNVDAELAYYYGWDDLPVYRINPALAKALNSGTIDGQTLAELVRLVAAGDYDGILQGGFHRLQVVGGGLSSAWRQFSFYAETALQYERVFYDQDLRAFFSPALVSVVGGEYLHSEKLVVHLELFDNSLVGRRRQALGMEPDTYGCVCYCTGSWLDQSLTPELRLVYFINNRDWILNPRITYSFTDHLSATLGAAIFQGSGPVEIRTFLDLSRITPVSLLSENDWVDGKVQVAF